MNEKEYFKLEAEKERGFYQNYRENVAPVLEKYEPERKQKLHIFIFVELFLIAISAVSIHYIWINILEDMNSTWFAIMATLMIANIFIAIIGLVFCGFHLSFSKKIKKLCLKKILLPLGDFAITEGENDVCLDAIRQSNMFYNFNYMKNDDVFKGSIEGKNFNVIEADLQVVGNRSNRSVFDGVIIHTKTSNISDNRIIIYKKGTALKKTIQNLIPSLFMGVFVIYILYLLVKLPAVSPAMSIIKYIIGIFLIVVYFCLLSGQKSLMSKKTSIGDGYDKIKNQYELVMESSENDCKTNFDFNSADELFTRLEELKKAFGVKNVSLSIYKDDVIVALYGMKNFFEAGSIFTPLTSEKMINDLYGQFISILLFVLYIKQFFDKDKTPAIN